MNHFELRAGRTPFWDAFPVDSTAKVQPASRLLSKDPTRFKRNVGESRLDTINIRKNMFKRAAVVFTAMSCLTLGIVMSAGLTAASERVLL